LTIWVLPDLREQSRSSILVVYSKDSGQLHASLSSLHGQQCRHFGQEPRWQYMSRFTRATLSADERLWLGDNGSLTARLMASGRGEFSVQRLFQGWAVPELSERTLLQLPPRQLALVREVVLMLETDAVVFARSVFPIASLTGSLGHLRRLQNTSLGAILFNHPKMRRYPFELALLAGNSDYLPAALQQPEPAWGRRSRFEISGKPLLVSEVFLRAFTPWPKGLCVHRSQRGKVGAAFSSPSH
jgi:chorismate--pyruvate lyase